MAMLHAENELRATGVPQDAKFADQIASIHESRGEDISVKRNIPSTIKKEQKREEINKARELLQELGNKVEDGQALKAWMTIHEYTVRGLGAEFKMPFRTVQRWRDGSSRVPPYLNYALVGLLASKQKEGIDAPHKPTNL